MRAIGRAVDQRGLAVTVPVVDFLHGHDRSQFAIGRYQRQLATAIKRARFLALLPYSDSHK